MLTLGSVNLDADDAPALAAFWAAALGSEISDVPGGAFYLPPGPFGVFVQPRGGPRPQGQVMHLDLTVPWGSRTSEVERLVGLGAVHRWDVLDEVPYVQWSTLEDPDGNLFCVAEHPPA